MISPPDHPYRHPIMNLQNLTDALAAYKDFLRKNPLHDPYWKWESLRVFQENWDIHAPDFKGMYDRSLQNSKTRRLWKRENYEPKDMMLLFIELNKEFVRQIFQDLFAENKEVDSRIDRFVFHCDELLREYRETRPRSVINNHFHDDNYQMVSLYLAFRYPTIYTPYHFDAFKKLMEQLGSRDIPQVNDVGRFFKVMRTLSNFLKKDEEILKIHQKRLDPAKHFAGETLLVVEDFMWTMTR